MSMIKVNTMASCLLDPLPSGARLHIIEVQIVWIGASSHVCLCSFPPRADLLAPSGPFPPSHLNLHHSPFHTLSLLLPRSLLPLFLHYHLFPSWTPLRCSFSTMLSFLPLLLSLPISLTSALPSTTTTTATALERRDDTNTTTSLGAGLPPPVECIGIHDKGWWPNQNRFDDPVDVSNDCEIVAWKMMEEMEKDYGFGVGGPLVSLHSSAFAFIPSSYSSCAW